MPELWTPFSLFCDGSIVVTVIVPALALGSARSSVSLPVAESSWALSSADDTGKESVGFLTPSSLVGLGS